MENGDDVGEIRNWSNKIEAEIKKFDPIMVELQEALKQIKLSERREEEKELLSSKQRQFEVESELEKARYEQKFQYERRLQELNSTSPPNEQESTKVKLPKLIISKFQGTHCHKPRSLRQRKMRAYVGNFLKTLTQANP